MRRRRAAFLCGLLALLAACGGGGGGGGAGVTGFVTADTRGGAAAPLPAGVDLGAPAADAAEGALDVAREIEEADVFAVDGDELVLLNVHRGLAVVDLAGPTVRGRLALPGVPHDLFLDADDALAVLGELDGRTSVVDVSLTDPDAPVERARRSVPGGPVLSRRIGSVLYVVTRAAVASFSTDGLLTPLDQVELPEGVHAAHVSTSVLALAGWSDGLVAPVRLVDVSSPSGDLALRGRVDVPGWIADEFKLDVFAGVLRVVSHDAADGGLSHLTTWSLANLDAPAPLGALSLARGEQLFATRFDGERAYVVTFERIDPLWVIDLADPASPTIAGELLVPGWSTHLVPLGTRLVALGVEPALGWGTVASLFDVSDPTAPALLDRADFGAGWSTAFEDVRGFGVFAAEGLVTVPLSAAESRIAVLDLGAATLDLVGDVGLAGTALRGFPHPRGLVCISTEEVVVADRSTLARAGGVTLAENVVDVVRTSDGLVRPLLAVGSGARLDGVDLPMWPQRAAAVGTNVAVIGTDDRGRAAYVVGFGGPTPVVSVRLELGDGWGPAVPPSAGMLAPDGVWGGFTGRLLVSPAGRLVVHAAPTGAADGFAVIDVSTASLEAPVALAEGFVTGFALDGETLAFTSALPVRPDEEGRPRLTHALTRIDLASRAVDGPVNVPGWILALDGGLAWTAEEVWGDGWSWTCDVVALDLAGAEPAVLDRLTLPEGAYDLRAAGRTLFFSRLGAWPTPGEPPGGIVPLDGERGGIVPGFDAGLASVRLGAVLALGPSIEARDAFRTLLLAEDGAALVVRDGVTLERWDVTGAAAARTFEVGVTGWPLAAQADAAPATYLVALGYGGWVRVP